MNKLKLNDYNCPDMDYIKPKQSEHVINTCIRWE